jgi:putative colanic acid biosynthesis acetyltransferase WcaF
MTAELKTHSQPSPYHSPWSLRQRLGLMLWHCCWSLFCAWTPKPLNGWRLLWLRLFGATIHGRPFVHPRARIAIPWHLTLHHRACLGDRANAYSLGEIELCEDSTVAQEAYLCTGTHQFDHPMRPLQTAKITVGPGAFICARAFILPGVTIGARAIVGACAVVTRNVANDTTVTGNPATPSPRARQIQVPRLEPPSHYINADSVRWSWTEGLLVLMYHLIETPPLRHRLRALYVEPSTLRAQLMELKSSGATFVTLSEWNQNRADTRQVAVTFDDGFQNVLHNGLPVLRELGIVSINYLVADLIGQTNLWDQKSGLGTQRRRLMDQHEILDWIQAGQEIGSHTLTHPHLTSLPLAEARREIFDSKKMLEDLFGQPIRHFCFPYGDDSERLRELVREAGYETATTTQPGTNPRLTDPFALHRILARHRRPYAVAWRGIFPP